MFAPKVPKAQTKAFENSSSNLPQRSTVLRHRLGHDPVESPLFLQRAIGNQATLRLQAQQTSRQQGCAAEKSMAGKTSRGASWDFSKIPLFPPDRPRRGSSPQPGITQRKLVVGQPDDPLEHEADRVADQVMRMPHPEIGPAAASPQISPKCAACEAEKEEQLQKREGGTSEATLGEAPASVHEALRSAGQPLDAATRAYFEPRFGQDFSKVRVHTGLAAERSARGVNAHAYTVGQNIIFDVARFAPGTHEGRRLLAHELTHVQQQSGPAPVLLRQPKSDKLAGTVSSAPPTSPPPASTTLDAPLPFIPAFDDDPQFKVEKTGSDYAGFTVSYSWPGEGKEPLTCTVNVRVTYSGMGKKGGKTEEFPSTNKIHNTGGGWAYFYGKAALDDHALGDVSIDRPGSSCGGRALK